MKEESNSVKGIREWVYDHEEELIRDLSDLVSIRSVSELESVIRPYGEGCRQVLETFLSIGSRYGFFTKNYQGHVGCISLKEASPKETIGIWTHLDVVDEEQGWTKPPYMLTREGEYLFGRGVQDNKGPVIGVLYALRYLKEQGTSLRLNKNFALYSGCSEENGMKDLEAFLSMESPPGFNLVADCVFPLGHGEKGILNVLFRKKLSLDSDILEFDAGRSINSIPSAARILLKKKEGWKERLWACSKAENRIRVLDKTEGIEIKGFGSAGHVAFPEGSMNAVYVLTDFIGSTNILGKEDEELIRFLNQINKDSYGKGAGIAHEDSISGSVCGALTIVKRSEYKAGSNEGAEVRMSADYRYPILGYGPGRLEELLKSTASEFGCTVQILKNDPPYYIEKEHSFIESVMRAYKKVTGSNSEPHILGGGTYARKLPNAVSYGMSPEKKSVYRDPKRPGQSGDCHQPDESQHLRELLEGVVIYIATLLELDRTEVI